MQPDANELIDKDFRPISGWTLARFVALLVPLAFGAVLLMRGLLVGELGKLIAIGVLYGVGLVAIVVAAAPMGPAAVPALAIRGAGWRPIVLGIVGTLAVSIAVSRFGPEVKGMEEVQEIVRQPHALVASILLLGVLAPLVEELIFRGLVYGWLEGRWGWPVAFVVSSLAFAAAHFERAHVIDVLPLGLLFGWLRRRTGSLLPSLAAHIVNNGFAVISVAYFDV